MKFDFKKWLPHLSAIVLFILIGLIYFSPVLEGYKLSQGDNRTFKGMSKEIRDHRDKFHEEPFWTNTPFGGMPASLISVQNHNNWMTSVQSVMELWLPHPVNLLFICMLSFYILLLCLRIDPWLSIVGAIAFGLSTYSILCLSAGHNTKVLAIGYMPAVLGAIIYTYRGNWRIGGALVMLFFALQLRANHVQITYYLIMILICYGIAEMINFIIKKELKSFLIRSAVVVTAVGFAVLPNYSQLKMVSEVGKETTRSKSELTIGPDGKVDKDKTTGLNKQYIVDWSYGIGESWNLIIPNAAGGPTDLIANHPELMDEVDPKFQQTMIDQRVYTYWGPQTKGTGGPTYLGAVIVLLFFLGMFYIRDRVKWGIFFITVLGLMLAWGQNYMPLTEWFIENVPGYNKLRAVTIMLCILMVTVPLIAIWGVKAITERIEEIRNNPKPFYIVSGILMFILLAMSVSPESFFSFISGEERKSFAEVVKNNPAAASQVAEFKKEIIAARVRLFTPDAWRAFGFCVVTFGLLFMYIRNLYKPYVLYAGLGLLVTIDMWSVNQRYLNAEQDDNGEYKSWILPEYQEMPFGMENADKNIFENEVKLNPALKEKVEAEIKMAAEAKASSGDEEAELTPGEVQSIIFRELNYNTNYRVMAFPDPFNDGRTPYFHKSIGGYHGAKQKRIQEIIEFHYFNEINGIREALMNEKPTLETFNNALKNARILSMMNTKYIVFNPGGTAGFFNPLDSARMDMNQINGFLNPYAQGNAWFVGKVQEVENSDKEIMALYKTDLTNTALVDKRYMDQLKGISNDGDASGTITFVKEKYKPNRLEYTAETNKDKLAVFSEIYSASGWKAYVDENETPIIRVNYLLRGIKIPAGKHKVEFIYNLPFYRSAETVSLAGSVFVILILLLIVFLELKRRGIIMKKSTPVESK